MAVDAAIADITGAASVSLVFSSLFSFISLGGVLREEILKGLVDWPAKYDRFYYRKKERITSNGKEENERKKLNFEFDSNEICPKLNHP